MHSLRVLVLSLFIVSVFSDFYEDVAFEKIGTYSNGKRGKTFFIPRHFKSHASSARAICKSYNMDIVSLETKEEADAFLSLCKSNSDVLDTRAHVGAITLGSETNSTWFWVASGNSIDYPLKFGIGQPNNYGGFQRCLTVEWMDNECKFNDRHCHAQMGAQETDKEEYKFVCERVCGPSCLGLTTEDP